MTRKIIPLESSLQRSPSRALGVRAIAGRWRADRRGTAAIELAIFAPVLAAMLVAVVEIGFAIRQQIQAQDAAAAGALYAGQHGWDSAGIASAVTGAKSGSNIAASPTPSEFCGCPSAAGVGSAACGATCTDGSTARTYVLVRASVARTSFFTSTLPLPATLTASATARLP
jgi:Flp pilus assembly protein TadG